MQELFKPIFDNTYMVSNLGNIFSQKTGKILTPVLTKGGYHQICLRVGGATRTYRLHKLITLGFMGAMENGLQVNHIDGNKLNNNIENLEYVTPSYNKKHSYMLGLSNKQGEAHHLSKLNNRDIIRIRELLSSGEKNKDIAKIFNVSCGCISHIRCGHTWGHVSYAN